MLMAHEPDYFVEAARYQVDLTLSGHTHGGQIRILGRAPLTHTRLGFVAGSYARGSSRLYVSRGVGVTVLPLRVGVRAEIPLIELVAPGQDSF